MLLIALALHSATMAGKMRTVAVAPPRVVRATLKRSARPHPHLSPLISACDIDRDCGARQARSHFRLTGTQEPLVDRKLEMVRAAQGPSCNRTGMPVCPGSGQQLLKLSY
ncbi:hypothetical protein SAMN03159338_3968 [Sphingomonas sp. NFR04]|uniref:hypothetical protein n=1 Tax=Sphingomonas sp. NFR04 TaxID=1566283 RepID=UPI0008E5A61D|nr:hypothetical protein [Sphingomonas sp. NFR04]SFK34767.1 hypothetical protein SAMN03159338_3968 [Sphingomonas sp. NFR04]